MVTATSTNFVICLKFAITPQIQNLQIQNVGKSKQIFKKIGSLNVKNTFKVNEIYLFSNNNN